MVLVAPSLLAADFTKLGEQLKSVASADWLHLDIMDGRFVPNISFGPQIIKQLRPYSNLFFDVHLMVENPQKIIPLFYDCGAEQITVHYEACADVRETLQLIKNRGFKVGISLKPDTSAEVLLPYFDLLDTILIMSVEPGFGGQKFITSQLEKIINLKTLIKGYNIKIEVDGGINLQTGKLCVQNGADILVAGSAIFKADNPENIIYELKKLGEL